MPAAGAVIWSSIFIDSSTSSTSPSSTASPVGDGTSEHACPASAPRASRRAIRAGVLGSPPPDAPAGRPSPSRPRRAIPLGREHLAARDAVELDRAAVVRPSARGSAPRSPSPSGPSTCPSRDPHHAPGSKPPPPRRPAVGGPGGDQRRGAAAAPSRGPQLELDEPRSSSAVSSSPARARGALSSARQKAAFVADAERARGRAQRRGEPRERLRARSAPCAITFGRAVGS